MVPGCGCSLKNQNRSQNGFFNKSTSGKAEFLPKSSKFSIPAVFSRVLRGQSSKTPKSKEKHVFSVEFHQFTPKIHENCPKTSENCLKFTKNRLKLVNSTPRGGAQFWDPLFSERFPSGPGRSKFSLIDHFLIPTDVVIPPRVGVGVEKKKHFFKNSDPPLQICQIQVPDSHPDPFQTDPRTLQIVDLDLGTSFQDLQIIKSGPSRSSFGTLRNTFWTLGIRICGSYPHLPSGSSSQIQISKGGSESSVRSKLTH